MRPRKKITTAVKKYLFSAGHFFVLMCDSLAGTLSRKQDRFPRPESELCSWRQDHEKELNLQAHGACQGGKNRRRQKVTKNANENNRKTAAVENDRRY